MPIKYQCPNCQDILTFADGMSGKDVFCPLCDKSVKVPKIDDEPVILEVDFRECLKKFNISEWDRFFSQKTYENKFASEKSIRNSIVKLRRLKSKGVKTSINKILLKDAKISEEENLQITEMLRGTVQKKVKLIKCPNCFASIPQNSSKCKYCEQKLGNLTVMDMCPNCMHEQPQGKKECNKCGANLKTGLCREPLNKSCPRCGNLMHFVQDKCKKCGYSISQANKKFSVASAVNKVLAVLPAVAFMLFLLGTVYAGIKWQDTKNFFITITASKEMAELKETVNQIDKAIEYDDYEYINSIIDSEKQANADKGFITILLGGKNRQKIIESIEYIKHTDFSISSNNKSATVYTECRAKYDINSVATQSSANFNDAVQNIASKKARILSSKFAWKFTRKEDAWWLVSPVE
jgi:uncharacterized Zn finger protein (UPF0148 family)